jgi:type IV pilus assembly protein PilB
MGRIPIGELLVQQGRLDRMQLESALAHQRRWGGRLGRAIVHLGFMDEKALLDALGAQLCVPTVEIGERFIPPHVLALLPEKLVRTRRVLPLARLSEARGGPLAVALADPADLAVLDEIAFVTGMQVKASLVAEPDLDRAIARHYGGGEPPRPTGFADREDAIELPEDTSPLGGGASRPGGGTTH